MQETFRSSSPEKYTLVNSLKKETQLYIEKTRMKTLACDWLKEFFFQPSLTIQFVLKVCSMTREINLWSYHTYCVLLLQKPKMQRGNVPVPTFVIPLQWLECILSVKTGPMSWWQGSYSFAAGISTLDRIGITGRLSACSAKSKELRKNKKKV